MEKKFKVSVNKSFDFNLSAKDINQLDVIKIDKKELHLLHQNKSYKAEVLKSNFKTKEYQILLNANKYQVKIADSLDILVEKLGFSIGSSKKINIVKAPMPGLILEIKVNEGQHVEEGETILILEAMKMENSITSPKDGIIKSVKVINLDAVEKGQLLIELEP